MGISLCPKFLSVELMTFKALRTWDVKRAAIARRTRFCLQGIIHPKPPEHLPRLTSPIYLHNALSIAGPRVSRECLPHSHVADPGAPKRRPGMHRDPNPTTNTTRPDHRSRAICTILVDQRHGQAEGPRSECEQANQYVSQLLGARMVSIGQNQCILLSAHDSRHKHIGRLDKRNDITNSFTQPSSATSSTTPSPRAPSASLATATSATGPSTAPGNSSRRSSAATRNSSSSASTRPCSLRARSCAPVPVTEADCSARP